MRILMFYAYLLGFLSGAIGMGMAVATGRLVRWWLSVWRYRRHMREVARWAEDQQMRHELDQKALDALAGRG